MILRAYFICTGRNIWMKHFVKLNQFVCYETNTHFHMFMLINFKVLVCCHVDKSIKEHRPLRPRDSEWQGSGSRWWLGHSFFHLESYLTRLENTEISWEISSILYARTAQLRVVCRNAYILNVWRKMVAEISALITFIDATIEFCTIF